MRLPAIGLLLSGCVATATPPPVDPIQQAQAMLGCWEGRRSDGRAEVLRIEPRSWGIELLSATGDGAACSTAHPFAGLERKEKAVVAYARLPQQYYAWTVSATPDTILFTPANAPVWLRLERLDANRIEWSSASYPEPGKAAIDATTLTRSPGQ